MAKAGGPGRGKKDGAMLCEAFLNRVIIARTFVEELPAAGAWSRLCNAPVMSIGSVEVLAVGESAEVLPVDSYAVDIDASGDGWVRAQARVGGRLRISGIAGIADGPNQVPEPVRQGILRLVSHLFSCRDGDGGEPPAAVTALWRPYRRIRLAVRRGGCAAVREGRASGVAAGGILGRDTGRACADASAECRA